MMHWKNVSHLYLIVVSYLCLAAPVNECFFQYYMIHLIEPPIFPKLKRRYLKTSYILILNTLQSIFYSEKIIRCSLLFHNPLLSKLVSKVTFSIPHLHSSASGLLFPSRNMLSPCFPLQYLVCLCPWNSAFHYPAAAATPTTTWRYCDNIVTPVDPHQSPPPLPGVTEAVVLLDYFLLTPFSHSHQHQALQR